MTRSVLHSWPLVLIAVALGTTGSAQQADTAAGVPYVAQAEEERDRFLEAMGTALKSIRSLRAEFVQERHVSLFLEPLSAKGICSFERPDRLRWELLEPYVSILILDARNVAKFDVVEGKLRRLELGAADLLREVLGQIAGWIRGDFSQADDVYELRLEKGSDYRLIMQPRSAEMRKMIRAVELSINPATHRVTQVVIREPGEDYLESRFVEEELNVTFQERVFDLKNPIPGVRMGVVEEG